MNIGDKVRIKINTDRDAEYPRGFGDPNKGEYVRSETLAPWDGVEFIYRGSHYFGVTEHAVLQPIDGYRPDEYNGTTEEFFWYADEVEAVE